MTNSSLEYTKTRRRENPLVRKEEILHAAISLAIKIGYQRITRESVASSANTSCGLVTHYFTTIEDLKTEIMRTAIEREIFSIIAQGLSLGDIQTKRIKKELKIKALNFLSNN